MMLGCRKYYKSFPLVVENGQQSFRLMALALIEAAIDFQSWIWKRCPLLYGSFLLFGWNSLRSGLMIKTSYLIVEPDRTVHYAR